jgi:hypothetical protein
LRPRLELQYSLQFVVARCNSNSNSLESPLGLSLVRPCQEGARKEAQQKVAELQRSNKELLDLLSDGDYEGGNFKKRPIDCIVSADEAAGAVEAPIANQILGLGGFVDFGAGASAPIGGMRWVLCHPSSRRRRHRPRTISFLFGPNQIANPSRHGRSLASTREGSMTDGRKRCTFTSRSRSELECATPSLQSARRRAPMMS